MTEEFDPAEAAAQAAADAAGCTGCWPQDDLEPGDPCLCGCHRLPTAECPEHGEQVVVDSLDGPPSMLGYGTDPDVLVLACGHRLTWSPLDGKPSIR